MEAEFRVTGGSGSGVASGDQTFTVKIREGPSSTTEDSTGSQSGMIDEPEKTLTRTQGSGEVMASTASSNNLKDFDEAALRALWKCASQVSRHHEVHLHQCSRSKPDAPGAWCCCCSCTMGRRRKGRHGGRPLLGVRQPGCSGLV